MKKRFLLCMLMLIIFVFTGCSQTNYAVVQYSNGSVEQIFSIDVDMNALNSAGITNSTDIENLKNKLYTEVEKAYKNSMARYKLSIRTDSTLSEAEKLKYENGVSTKFGWDNNTLAISITFENTILYNYYKNFQAGKDTAVQSVTENLFAKKTIKEVTTAFGQIYKDEKTLFEYFKDEYKNYILTNFSQETFDKLPKLTLAYAYVTPYSRMHTNADQTILTNIGYMHIWNFDENSQDFNIQIYYLTAKPVAWYLLGLMITFVFIAIYLMIIYFKKPKKTFYVNKDIF